MTEGLSRDKLNRLDRIFSDASSAVISTHAHPDGDAMGSSLALARYLRSRGLDVRVILPDPCPETLSFIIDGTLSPLVLTETGDIKAALERADLLVSIDYNSPHRTDALEEPIRSFEGVKVLIDHHISPEESFYDLIFSKEDISSSCELLYNVLLGMEDIGGKAERLGVEAGTALLLGMTTDSNNFANSTYPSTLEMAGELIAAGVDRDALLEKLYNRYRENRFRFMGYFLSEKLKITPEGVAYAVLSSEEIRRFEIRDGETEGFVNIPLGMEKVRMSLLLKEEESHDKMRVSIRSKRGTSANRFASAYFNGGGHEQASGGRLMMPSEVASAKEAEEYIIRCAGEFFAGEQKRV